MKKVLIIVAAGTALGIVFYLTKPGGAYSPSEGVDSADWTSDRGDAGPSENIVYWSPTKDGDPDGGAAGEGARKKPFRRKLHGAADVVRSRDVDEQPYRTVERPRYPADWKNPIEAPFRQLKALRREFRRAGDFDDETVRKFSGAAAIVSGAVMPIDPVPDNGRMKRFWIANTVIVMAGCVFCFPPTMGDLVYVDAERKPYKVDREQLYRGIVEVKALGRLSLGPGRSQDGVEYMFGMELSRVED